MNKRDRKALIYLGALYLSFTMAILAMLFSGFAK
jgi:hypothetical protein